jgi:signal transduction histidine kinase
MIETGVLSFPLQVAPMTFPLPFPETEHPLQLLVVDDQEFDRKMICTRLREVAPADTTILEAGSGKEAMDVINNSRAPIDCVLLDMNLPDIHGVDLTTMMLGLNPDISIVMITVEADMDKALKCLKAGAEDFLIKGEYTNFSLYRAVRYAIERHRSSVQNLQLNEALKRAKELSTAQKEFIHLVSHEFRTPIAIISGAMQLLAAKAPEVAAGVGAKQFQRVEGALKRLIGLLDNVLRLSMVEEGKEVFSPELFDMNKAIQQVAEYFDEQRLNLSLSADIVHYYGDHRLVEYALHNVISNAIKYSPLGTQVDIIMRTMPAALEIAVVDKGPGMSAEMMRRAGEKFHRDEATSHIEGTGLGIYLAKRFMEYHGGEMLFESEGGQGTTVRLIFPYSAALLDS